MERNPWSLDEAEVAEAARVATEDALAAAAEDRAALSAVAAAAAAATGGRVSTGDAEDLWRVQRGCAVLDPGMLMSSSEQETVRTWLRTGITVKQCATSGGSGTRKRKMRLEEVEVGAMVRRGSVGDSSDCLLYTSPSPRD